MASRSTIRFAIIILIFSLAAYAQQQTGRIDGVVTDATGAMVPGATVVLTGATTAQIETATSANGDYHFLNLSPGSYSVTAKLPGFADVVRLGPDAQVERRRVGVRERHRYRYEQRRHDHRGHRR